VIANSLFIYQSMFKMLFKGHFFKRRVI